MDGKIYSANNNHKKAVVAMLILDRENFKASKIIENKETLHKNKEKHVQEDLTILIMYTSNNKHQNM